MDLGTIIGVGAGFALILGAIIGGGAGLNNYLSFQSVLIVIGGSFCAMLVATNTGPGASALFIS